ncbi:YceI family protein [Parapedobacter indicus]|uniref:YceI-like domain-containing protein n=1 Tax=Parapedobacter indicus TaxID=1477437 RepID=A0A1I3F667_9SPHI|nr:YceI family protein [Parapedobacter indicus]PPL03577.1 YceI-like domain-containing protein [Parapedobacter indicus]SFI06640.1 YceI-like domain-containing protein [Parapedobacter indicus]
MRKLVAWFFVMFLCRFAAAQDILIDKNSRISFFSEAPLENIEAVTSKAAAALDIKANEVAFKVPVSSFEFRKQLMREHFNENYLESEKFPYATFKGKINEAVDWNVDGTYPVTVVGMLDIHGIKKRYETQATVEVKGSVINAQATFVVKVADHEIEIPRIVIKNIAEQVDVKVSSTFHKQ